ncbi:Apple-like protein [Cynara cardunculus var. scolymus]|uniref:non-specific serine/threonine protein kinase n=1 Tax=Cynara cardunculus var. scolymus TaxID=59895 RepID=A0A103XF71_CYNCS|nr:Apple-like protein [Cynara cardunculus var. scolymus]
MKTFHIHGGIIIFFFFILSFCNLNLSLATDIITPTQPLAMNQTLISSGEAFELGFFNLSNNNLYLGIWYRQIRPRTYVWLANRDAPINSSFVKLTIGDDGNIKLVDRSETAIWSSNQSVPVNNMVAQLLDSGNFVLRRENDDKSENYIWQSFDYPTDTLLPGMKIGWNRTTGINRFLKSWKSNNDPSSGDYSFKMNIDGFPELIVWHNETKVCRSGPWNGRRFSGIPEMKGVSIMHFDFHETSGDISYSFRMLNSSVYSRLTINSSGNLQRSVWLPATGSWRSYWNFPRDICDKYGEACGPFGVCDTSIFPVCRCLKGFRPRDEHGWFELQDGSSGCVRSSKMECGSDGFLPLKNMKLPEGSKAVIDSTMNLSRCEEICKTNCSCTAYANMDVTRGGSGCVIWMVDLIDMRQFSESESGGQDLYVRVAASDLEESPTTESAKNGSNNGNRAVKIVVIGAGICAGLITLLILLYLKRKNRRRLMKSIAHRIDNFSNAKELGEGGFGCVYKGTLPGGEVVAVKRLSRVSDQGIDELTNEVRLIAKLQHKNLVRLLGCCIEVEEKLLIYEFMENRSLDTLTRFTKSVTEKEKSTKLSWQLRLDIIHGIARGLMYLHQDSRFKIIHRDLKASNILLDEKMNPKISDFGMARIFGNEENEAKTKKVVGTYGYMSPEYAMNGHFSTKSDVFSFGVLVLEITWTLWKEGKALKLVDESIRDKFLEDEAIRCIQIGLLCVQEQKEDRPCMSKVLWMLNSEIAQLPQPKYPGFFIGKRQIKAESSSKQDDSVTINEVTITMIDEVRTRVRIRAPTTAMVVISVWWCRSRRLMETFDSHGSTFIFIFSLYIPFLSLATDIITPTQPLAMNETLVSSREVFELGFFHFGNNNLYLGIWYRQIQPRTIVWVANRDAPINSSFGKLIIGDDGNIVLVDRAEIAIWSSNQSVPVINTVAQLLDSGNFVLRRENDENTKNYIWQSFDHPTDTLLPRMKLGLSRTTGINRVLKSWKSNNNPASGDYSFGINIHGFPEFVLRDKETVTARTGPWNGIMFSGTPEREGVSIVNFNFQNTSDEIYFSFETVNSSVYSRYLVSTSGDLQRFTWTPAAGTWSLYWKFPWDRCDNYNRCGPFGICDVNSSPICKCLSGFRPGSNGCVRSFGLDCGSDGFQQLKNIKLPEGSKAFIDETLNLSRCAELCKRNCSCTAYANMYVPWGGSGCAIWVVDLMDMRQYAESESGHLPTGKKSKNDNRVVKIVAIVVGLITLLILVYLKRKNTGRLKKSSMIMINMFFYDLYLGPQERTDGETQIDELDLPLLSRVSHQGIEELKNEVELIAKLQHRNLVRLLGCCIDVEEKLLIYEFMENKSLDAFLFDQEKKPELNWQLRLDIIDGIARGLLYLHQDSRFKIIHRDLKASNILLDKKMNPKISDFGMARIFGSDQTEAKTKKVVGTYFGVLVLEIVSGKKNSGSLYTSNELNLLAHVSTKYQQCQIQEFFSIILFFLREATRYTFKMVAWTLWKEGKALELVDESVEAKFLEDEALRCIQIGLLCVQEQAKDRPSMSKVVLMLNSETAKLPQPKYPGFFIGKKYTETESSSKQNDSVTVNEVTITVLDVR